MTPKLLEKLADYSQRAEIQRMEHEEPSEQCPICEHRLDYRHNYNCTFERLKFDDTIKLLSSLETCVRALEKYADETRWATGFGGTEVFNCKVDDHKFGCDIAKSALTSVASIMGVKDD